jgi:ketosteroid isomerase-like protein
MSKHKKIVEQFWDAWNAKDVRGAAALMAEDCLFEVIGEVSLAGRDVFVQANLDFSDALKPGARLTVRTMVEEGDVVACTGSGVMTGGHTDLEYNNRYAWIFTFSGDEISHVEEYCDTKLLHVAVYGQTLS